MNRRFQFSLRMILWVVTGLAASLAAIVQVPHVFVFAVSCGVLAGASLAVYWTARQPWRRLAAVVGWVFAAAGFYVLSLGPFIALSELERKITGQFCVGRLAFVFKPLIDRRTPLVRCHAWEPFRWYIRNWIPRDPVGLHALHPKVLPKLIGTWRGERGNTFTLQANGGGWGKSDDYNGRSYFEWTADAQTFNGYFHPFSDKRNAIAWFGHEFIRYVPPDKYDIVEISAVQLRLRETTGKILSFTRTTDQELESLP